MLDPSLAVGEAQRQQNLRPTPQAEPWVVAWDSGCAARERVSARPLQDGERVWMPAADGVHELDARTGRERRVLATGAPRGLALGAGRLHVLTEWALETLAR